MNPYRRTVNALAAAVHGVHGTRGLMIVLPLLLAFTLLDPALPNFNRLPLVLPLFVLLVAAILTLPREGVTAQVWAKAVVDEERGVRRLATGLIWPAILCILLLPRVFLAAYGIPHLSPTAGLLNPTIVQRVASVYMLAVLLIPLGYLRWMRRYGASHVRPQRPKDGMPEGMSSDSRDILLLFGYVLMFAWAALLSPFWHPFSLVQWPPSLDSLRVGPRGVAAFAYSNSLPMVMFMLLAGHLALVRRLIEEKLWRVQPGAAALAASHVALIITACALHAYDLLWIARYQSAAVF